MGDLRISKDDPFCIGVAYSPRYGHNFGDAVWGVEDGLHHAARALRVRRDFAEYARHGVSLVSTKVFDDGRTGIDFDASDCGTAVRVQASALDGLANILDAAHACGIHVHLVLFDHLFAYPGGGGRARGHGGALEDPVRQDALFANVIVPVLRSIGRHPSLTGLELINEPDLIGRGLHPNRCDEHGRRLAKLDPPALVAVMRRFRDAVEAHTDAQFAIGCLGVGKAPFWLDAGVLNPGRDFLSIHYFGNRANGDPPYSKLYGAKGIGNLLQGSVPIVWGEHRADGHPATSVLEFLEDAYRYGVKACCAWAAYDGMGRPRGDGFGPLPLGQYGRFARSVGASVA